MSNTVNREQQCANQQFNELAVVTAIDDQIPTAVSAVAVPTEHQTLWERQLLFRPAQMSQSCDSHNLAGGQRPPDVSGVVRLSQLLIRSYSYRMWSEHKQ